VIGEAGHALLAISAATLYLSTTAGCDRVGMETRFVRHGEMHERRSGRGSGRVALRTGGSKNFGCERPTLQPTPRGLKLKTRRGRGRGTHVGAGELGLVLSVAAVVRHDRCFSLAAVLTRRGGAHARLELPSGSARELGQTTTQRRRKNKKTREGFCFAAICWLTRIELRYPSMTN
jgi:hypothetical protein